MRGSSPHDETQRQGRNRSHACAILVRVARDLSFGKANTFFLAAVLTTAPVFDCRGGFEAGRAEGSEWRDSAISSPNKAATLLSSSNFAALGGDLVSVSSSPAPAISSFSSTPRSTKSS